MLGLDPQGMGKLVSRCSPKQLEFVCTQLSGSLQAASLQAILVTSGLAAAVYLLYSASFYAQA